ncbi:MAG TPA: hypothetical protein VFJ82_08395 [Longimicrobium sp.]|nr:hypothetical protein [Longimicrobium sp.]
MRDSVGTLRIRFTGGGHDARALAALVGTAAASAPSAGAGGERVVLVRRARVDLPVGAASPEAAAVRAGRALEGALRDALRRPRDAGDVRVFHSTAEYLAHFVEELAAGRPVDVWYFGPLLAHRGRGLGDTLANLARAEPAAWPQVLRLLRRRGLLPALLARLEGQAREALRGVPPPPARPLGPDEGWPLFAAAWDAALAALGRGQPDAPADPAPHAHADAPPPGTLPASAREAFRHYLDTHPAAPESWGVPAALGGCVARMVDWLLRRAGVAANSAAGAAALARHPWIDPAPVRRVLRDHAAARAAARPAPPPAPSAAGDAPVDILSFIGGAPHPRALRWGGMNRTRALRFLRAARLLVAPPAPRAAGAPEGEDDDPFLELQDEVWAVDAAAAHLASRGVVPALDPLLALLEDADPTSSPRPPAPSAPPIAHAPAGAASAAPPPPAAAPPSPAGVDARAALQDAAAPALPAPSAAPEDATPADRPRPASASTSEPSPVEARLEDGSQEDAAAVHPAPSAEPVDSSPPDRPHPAPASADPPATGAVGEREDEPEPIVIAARGDAGPQAPPASQVAESAASEDVPPHVRHGFPGTDAHRAPGSASPESRSAPPSPPPSHARAAEDETAPRVRDTDAADAEDGHGAPAVAASHSTSPSRSSRMDEAGTEDEPVPHLRDADAADPGDGQRAAAVAAPDSPVSGESLGAGDAETEGAASLAAAGDGGRRDAPERTAAGPLAVMAAAARQLEPGERRELAGALAARARARPARLRTEAAGVFFLVRPWTDLGLPGLAARAGVPPSALRALLYQASTLAAGAPPDDPAAAVVAWGTPAGEWNAADPPIPPGDPRRAALADALRDRAARLGLPLGPAETDGDQIEDKKDTSEDGLAALLVEAGCRQLVRWMHGFQASSTAYVLREIVRRPGGVRAPPQGPVEVAWPSCAMDVLLERAGYLDPLPAVAWWDGRGLRWER